MREGEVVRAFRADGADTIFRYPRLDHLSKGDSTGSAGGWQVRVCGQLASSGRPDSYQAEPNPADVHGNIGFDLGPIYELHDIDSLPVG